MQKWEMILKGFDSGIWEDGFWFLIQIENTEKEQGERGNHLFSVVRFKVEMLIKHSVESLSCHLEM